MGYRTIGHASGSFSELPFSPLLPSFNAPSFTINRSHKPPNLSMTRSHKLNDRDYPADGMMGPPRENIPRYFGKSGPTDADPRKTKKDGGGKGNWGRSGDEVQDYGYTMNNARRRSNSSTQGLADFRTKFETVDPEPVFEEQLHGPADEIAVTKVESTSSSNNSEADQAGMKY